jgi:preprotein translocase subunit SecF
MISSFIPLRLIPDKLNIGFIKISKFCYIFSILITLFSFFSFYKYRFNFGIDFTGGTIIEISSSNTMDINKINHELSHMNLGEVIIQNFGTNQLMIKFSSKTDDINTIQKVKASLLAIDKKITFDKIDYVGPQIGEELIKSGVFALALSFLSIMIYIAIRFEWHYGLGILITLIHDSILSLCFLSFTGLELNTTSIAALLTIIGYSVNDSVVIYDRIRENRKRHKTMKLADVIDLSINETLSRTVLTVLTTLIAVLALVFYAGETLKSFSLTVFFGILFGTYSSIFISAPLLIALNNKKH